MFVEPAIIGLLFAWIRKGRLRNIERLDIRGWYLFFIGALIQLSLSLGKALNFSLIENIVENHFFTIYLTSYMFLILGVLANIDKRFMKFILLGLTLNGLVIFSNGGKMPVSLEGIRGEKLTSQISQREFDIKHEALDADTRLKYLADIILIPKPYPLARIISLGDIFIMLGVVVFFPDNMIYRSEVKYFFSHLTKNGR